MGVLHAIPYPSPQSGVPLKRWLDIAREIKRWAHDISVYSTNYDAAPELHVALGERSYPCYFARFCQVDPKHHNLFCPHLPAKK